jgi:predicted enzyme related to lactoylglutathione lyase
MKMTMLKVTEIAFSCYAVTDIARARNFYEGVLGLKPTTIIEGKWVEYEFGPYALAIGCAPGMFNPSPDGCSVALEVENFDEAVAHLRANNVKFRIEPMPTPVCHMTMVHDPDGNSVCIHKRKAK